MLDADLANIFADTSLTVSVELGASSARGFFATEDNPEPDGGGGIILASRQTVTVQTGALGTIANGDAITVNGNTYRVHSFRARGRGKTLIVLA